MQLTLTSIGILGAGRSFAAPPLSNHKSNDRSILDSTPSMRAEAPSLHAPTVGIFDSGVGGLGVLGPLRRLAPALNLLYLADTACAPYGDQPDHAVRERTLAVAGWFRRQGVDVFVIACNTATAAAVDAVRAAHPGWPVVGIEPALKPAFEQSRSGRVGLLATRGTVESPRLRRLQSAHASGATLYAVACSGLADAIERDGASSPAVQALVERYAAPLREAGCDIVVLGCTHYPFAMDAIAGVLGPGVTLIDPAQAVARRALNLIGPRLANARSGGAVSLCSTARPERLAAFAARHWPGLPPARLAVLAP